MKTDNRSNMSTVVSFMTLALGFFPFLIISLATGTFWPRSRVAVPLSLSPSIVIGDGLLLPIFNGMAAAALIPVFGVIALKRLKVRVAIWGVLLLACSTILNVYLHIRWSQDRYTGFIDPEYGRLSLGGKWHCAFASGELAFIVLLLITCVTFKPDNRQRHRNKVLRLWRVLIGYASMSIADVVFMIIFVHRPISELSLPDYFALSPLI